MAKVRAGPTFRMATPRQFRRFRQLGFPPTYEARVQHAGGVHRITAQGHAGIDMDLGVAGCDTCCHQFPSKRHRPAARHGLPWVWPRVVADDDDPVQREPRGAREELHRAHPDRPSCLLRGNDVAEELPGIHGSTRAKERGNRARVDLSFHGTEGLGVDGADRGGQAR